MKTEVIVIGAGMAGLAAARELQNLDYDTVVLEGRDRTGGRIWTDRSLGFAVDLGASWIHGVDGNPIAALASEAGARTVETDYDNLWMFDSDGKELPDDLVDTHYEYHREILEEATGTPSKSLSKAIVDLLEEDMSGEAWKFFRYNNRSIQITAAADLEDLDAEAFEGDEAFGGEDVIFPDGYDRLLDHVARGTDIRPSHTVEQIIHGSDGVEVVTNRGRFFADCCIVTLPLGVLQSDSVKFQPKLPEEKLASLQNLKMGTLNKVVLHYDEAFWPVDPDFIEYVPPESEFFQEYLNLQKLGQKPALMSLTGGSEARSLEPMEDHEVMELAEEPLRRMFPGYRPARAMLRSSWHSDPFARGSYSTVPPGGSFEDHKVLGQSVDCLYFAGEHTNPEYPGTVHGAYLSGIRAARELDEEW